MVPFESWKLNVCTLFCEFPLRNSYLDLGFLRSTCENSMTLAFNMLFSTYHWLPRWLSGKKSTRQCRSHSKRESEPWVWKIHWRRKWQLNPVFLPGKSHGQKSLAGYSSWCHKRVRHDWGTKQQQRGLEKTQHKHNSESHEVHVRIGVYTDQGKSGLGQDWGINEFSMCWNPQWLPRQSWTYLTSFCGAPNLFFLHWVWPR